MPHPFRHPSGSTRRAHPGPWGWLLTAAGLVALGCAGGGAAPPSGDGKACGAAACGVGEGGGGAGGGGGSPAPLEPWTFGLDFAGDSVGLASDGALLVAGGYDQGTGEVMKLSRGRDRLWSKPLDGDGVEARVAGGVDGGAVVAHTFTEGSAERRLGVSALSSEGSPLWSRKFASADFRSVSVGVDSAGWVWVAGTAFGAQDFGLGSLALGGAAFVVAFDASGATTFHTTLAGPAFAISVGLAITPDQGKLVVVENAYEAVTGPAFTLHRLDAIGAPQWAEDLDAYVEPWANGANMGRARATASGGIAFTRFAAPADTFSFAEPGGLTQWFAGGRGVAPTPGGDLWVVDGTGGVGGTLQLHRLPAGGGAPLNRDRPRRDRARRGGARRSLPRRLRHRPRPRAPWLRSHREGLRLRLRLHRGPLATLGPWGARRRPPSLPRRSQPPPPLRPPASTSATLFASNVGVSGFWTKSTPESRTPCCSTASSV